MVMAERQKLESLASHIKKIADLPDSMGLFLQQQREKLPDLRHHCKDIAARRDEISHVKLELFELDSNRSDLADTDPEVAADADPEVAAVMNAIAAIAVGHRSSRSSKSPCTNCWRPSAITWML